ncbi:ferric-chelate reductase [Histoplasma capsulatum H143]|uniref:Ferric-chelate reductase n=1 Tax=Ajellomyces capsulatus (strain H143) TaxID=544712 RepID=C6H8W8_AJECH|nr:ferric-chelate reductase [Histoplasma capsulatum H143]
MMSIFSDHYSKTKKDTGDTITVIRIHLILPWLVKVWAGQYINHWMPSVNLLNDLLKEDILDSDYILTILIYVENEHFAQNKVPFVSTSNIVWDQLQGII